jgi:pyruvate formate lyase activating enzyme
VCGACVQACHAQAREIVGRELTVGQVLAEIEKDMAFYDESGGGVTFSGGEPLLQPDFLLALLQACQERGIHTAVDTSGFARWETLDRIREHVDLFLYDLKLMDDAEHRRFTGVSNRPILRNLRMLAALGHKVTLRLPIIPAVNDADEDIRQIGAFVSDLPHAAAAGPRPAGRVDILPYHHAAFEKCHRLGKTYGLPDTRPPSDERMAHIARMLEGFGLHVKIGG